MSSDSYNVLVGIEQGGARGFVASGGSFDVESGGEVDIESGGALKIAGTQVTASANDLNASSSIPFDYTLTPAAGAANVCEVTIQAKDPDGAAIAHVVPLLVWLSDAATGAGLTATTASGNVEAKAASGTVLSALTAKKALLVQTLADGSFVLSITDTAKTAFKVCVQSPQGETPTIATLETADYGS